MNTKTDLIEYLLRLGDSALIQGQRLCQWCGKAPALEEELALMNVGLDLVGVCLGGHVHVGRGGGRRVRWATRAAGWGGWRHGSSLASKASHPPRPCGVSGGSS